MSIPDDRARDLDRAFGEWRKSSFSKPNGNECVEVAIGTDAVALRDSKHPDGAVLVFHRAEWSAFVAGVTAGEFEIPSR